MSHITGKSDVASAPQYLRRLWVVATVVAGMVQSPAPATAQTSELYLVSLRLKEVQVYRNGALTRNWPTVTFESAIAVADTVRTLGYKYPTEYTLDPGSEYTPSGVFTGTRFPHPLSPPYPMQVLADGTTDGTHNSGVGGDRVWRFDRDWQNPQLLFTLDGTQNLQGITYDPADRTLWLSDWSPTDQVLHVALDGTILGRFHTGFSNMPGIALDPADGTLWVLRFSHSAIQAEQFDKAGNHLGSLGPFPVFDPCVYGAEFAMPDVTPPTIADLNVSRPVLWPPNHKMVDVLLDYTVTDDRDPAPAVVVSVTSNEPENGLGDGDTGPDWEIVDAHHLRLRAERAGNGTGRVYSITITCTDASGNVSAATATVTVPKSQAK